MAQNHKERGNMALAKISQAGLPELKRITRKSIAGYFYYSELGPQINLTF
jgi:hypothetical protein